MQLNEKNKIVYLQFLMSVLVILIHSINNDTKFERLFSINDGLGQFAVPLFFVVSGFLFFRTSYTINDVRNKLKKRIFTLLIPYILWNLIYYMINLLMKPGTDITFMSLFDAAFNYTYNPPFWFMWQLILLNVISPFLFYLLSDIKKIIIAFLILFIIIGIGQDIPYINEDAIVYYFAGAVISKLYNNNKIKFISKKNILITFILFIVLFSINRLLYNMLYKNYNSFINLFILSVILVRLSFSFFIFYFVDLFSKYDRVYDFMRNSFFLYAIHYMIARFLINILQIITLRILNPYANYTIEIVTFLLTPVICIVVNMYIIKFLKKNFYKIYIILSGDR